MKTPRQDLQAVASWLEAAATPFLELFHDGAPNDAYVCVEPPGCRMRIYAREVRELGAAALELRRLADAEQEQEAGAVHAGGRARKNERRSAGPKTGAWIPGGSSGLLESAGNDCRSSCPHGLVDPRVPPRGLQALVPERLADSLKSDAAP